MFGLLRLRPRGERNVDLPVYPRHAPRLRLAVYLYALVIAFAIVFTVLQGKGEPLLNLATGGSALVLLALYGLYARPGSRAQRQTLFEWAAKRYEVHLHPVAIRNLTLPTRDEGYIYGDWSSLPVNVLHENESGEETWVEVRLCREEGHWFLFSPDYGKELPPVEPSEMEASLIPILGEIIEHNGVYVVAADEEDWAGKIVDATDLDTGEKALLFWTDQLRAELWLGGANLPEGTNLTVKEMDYFGFRDGFLKVARENYPAVGVNWGADGYQAFTPRDLTRFFNDHLAPVEVDDDEAQDEDED